DEGVWIVGISCSQDGCSSPHDAEARLEGVWEPRRIRDRIIEADDGMNRIARRSGQRDLRDPLSSLRLSSSVRTHVLSDPVEPWRQLIYGTREIDSDEIERQSLSGKVGHYFILRSRAIVRIALAKPAFFAIEPPFLRSFLILEGVAFPKLPTVPRDSIDSRALAIKFAISCSYRLWFCQAARSPRCFSLRSVGQNLEIRGIGSQSVIVERCGLNKAVVLDLGAHQLFAAHLECCQVLRIAQDAGQFLASALQTVSLDGWNRRAPHHIGRNAVGRVGNRRQSEQLKSSGGCNRRLSRGRLPCRVTCIKRLQRRDAHRHAIYPHVDHRGIDASKGHAFFPSRLAVGRSWGIPGLRVRA